jgi:peptidoglycan/LPS O-acetylase OafA/YrhL
MKKGILGNTYNGAVDFWKFIFCMVILAFHVGEYYGTGHWLLSNGKYAVEFFFVVSGYLMCVSAQKAEKRQAGVPLQGQIGRETFSFLLKKIRGILPAYLFAYCISLIVWVIYVGIPLYHAKGLVKLMRAVFNILPNFLLIFNSSVRGTSVMDISWYISAMLAVMLIIYPLLRRFGSDYCLIASPAIVLFMTGFVYHTCKGYEGYAQFERFATKGVIRAIIGLNIGCIACAFANYLNKISFTRLARVLLMIIEIMLYGSIIGLMNYGNGDCVYIINILLLFAVSITFSKCSIWSHAFDHQVMQFLGKTTLYVYLCQSSARQLVYRKLPDIGYVQAFIWVAGLTFLFTAVGMLLTKGISTLYYRKFKNLPAFFVTAEHR